MFPWFAINFAAADVTTTIIIVRLRKLIAAAATGTRIDSRWR